MRKTLSALILLAMLLSLTACGADRFAQQLEPDPSTDSTVSAAITTQPSETPTNGVTTNEPIDPVEPFQIGDITVTPDKSCSNQFSASKIDPISLLALRQISDSNYLYISSEDGATEAIMDPDGYVRYFYSTRYAEDEFVRAPWWETQEIPDGVELAKFVTRAHDTECTTNFFPDLPTGLLQDIENIDPLYILRSGYLYLLYPSIAYAYKQGTEGQHWNLELQEGCFITTFDDTLRIYNGSDKLFKLHDDGTASISLDHITDAANDYFYTGVLDALAIKDSVLTLYCITTYRANTLSGVIADNVADAKFACDTIVFTGTDGYTYAFDGEEYYDALDDPQNLTNRSWEIIKLGTEPIEFYANAYVEYAQRDDIIYVSHSQFRHDFLVSFTN